METSGKVARLVKAIAYEMLIVSLTALLVILGLNAFNRSRLARQGFSTWMGRILGSNGRSADSAQVKGGKAQVKGGKPAAGPSGPSSVEPRVRHPLSVGAPIKLKGADFHGHILSLILVSSPTCVHCVRSAEFHRALNEFTHRHGVPFYVAIPDQRDATEYTRSAGFPESSVREFADLDVRVTGTPTLMAVDSNGIVRHAWLGELTTAGQQEVREAVESPSRLDELKDEVKGPVRNTTVEVPNYSLQQLRRMKTSSEFQIIDTHERDEGTARQQGAVLIPMQELPIRELFELDRSRLQVVDCSNLIDFECRKAAAALMASGFKVATLGAGGLEQMCGLEHVN